MMSIYFTRNQSIFNCCLTLLLLHFLSFAQAAPGDISTIAGNGASGLNPDEWQYDPKMVQFNKASDLVVDNQNNRLYVADTFNNRIRSVPILFYYYYSGVMTIAGSGGAGEKGKYGGDGGPATQAKLNNPWGVALDNQGNIYIADSDNHRIRKVDAGGTIITVAGNGTLGSAGDGGVATAAQLNFPDGVAVDGAGNLYIADTGNHAIRKVDKTGMITRIAGTVGQAGFSGDGGRAIEAKLNTPKRVTVTNLGTVYIVDKGNHRIRKVDPNNGIITTVVGNGKGYGGDGGPATGALLNSPSAVVLDGRGNLYIADTENHRIRKVDTVTNTITTIVGTLQGFAGDGGPAKNAQLNYPDSVTLDKEGNLYIADTDNHRIRKVENVASANESGGISVTDNLWMKSIIQTTERPPIEAVWKQGGDKITLRGDRVIWGYFYASPNDVGWGYEQNPDLFVKIWYDVTGRVDVNFFHVSVPEIEVYSTLKEVSQAAYSRSTMQKRYVRHTYKPQENLSEIDVAETVESSIMPVQNNPTRYSLPFYGLGLGAQIQTEERGPIDGVFKLGGSGRTPRGDEVAWGFFYANPNDVVWGNSDNPDVYVKVWVDVSGRIDVNFFHVSVPDIKVYSGHGGYEKQGTLTMSQRYTRHEYSRN